MKADWDEPNEEIDYFEGVDQVQINERSIGELTALSMRAVTLEAEISKVENILLEKQEELRRIKQQTIPSIMQSIGLMDFSLSDGRKIAVKNKIRASIKADDKQEAFKWLENNGYGGIVKTEVNAAIGKGMLKEAFGAVDALRRLGLDAKVDRSVHHKTLESFVKERLSDGESLPECFSVYEFKEAEISSPKNRK